MKIKKFKTKTMQEALSQIRATLGDDAVILSQQKIQGDNGPMLEVTAAVETEQKNETVAPIALRPHMPKTTHSLAAILNQHGIDEEISTKVTRAISALEETGFDSTDTLDMVLGKIVPFAAPAEAFDKSKTHVFLGPNGSGKTTTLCKIAVQKKFDKHSIGLITLDFGKIGAFEQINIFAKAIGEKAYMVSSKEDWDKVPESVKNADYLFIDTPGLSPYKKEQVSSLSNTLKEMGLKDLQLHLVAPGSLHDKELLMLPSAYASLSPDTLIFTKLDETMHYGGLINLAVSSGLKVCYITDGPNIPDDLVELDAASLAQKISTSPRYPWEDAA
jgi:flagellar biosynthesis protein FlhF